MALDQDVEKRLNAALADRYRIEREIGSGGMATVFQAQDLRHDRKVAVKVMKPELAVAMGAERFLTEIRTTASLQHPHILPLFDSGEVSGFLFYVMPYVEGESLAERLDREGQLPVEEAVRVAGLVADALDYAHRQGVIHRDIKPANILFGDEQPMVTDFGIALAVSAAGEGRLTESGLSLGTPYYMSPEQAAGDRTPTAASDVYSLGCVLYEMLTGDPPHTGSSAQAVLGKILLGEVTRPTKLRRTIPANVEGAILKALERLPADRFESVAELAAALKDKSFRHGVGAAQATGPWKWLTVSLGVVAVLAVAVAFTGVLAPEPPPPPAFWQEIRPLGLGYDGAWVRWTQLAPDGSSMVYEDSIGVESGWRLWVKERGSVEGRPLSGTENASDVVYSPDGQWIAYGMGGDILKRPIHGTGTQILLEDVEGQMVALDWMPDGTILCGQAGGVLLRVPADVSSEPDTVLGSSLGAIVWVHGLPGEKAALAVRCVGSTCEGGANLILVDLDAGTTRMLQEEVLRAWYTPTGHLVWVRRDGTVFATPFDLDRLELSGTHTALFDGVLSLAWVANMLLEDDGTVRYWEVREREPLQGEVVWVDRDGQVEPVDPDWGVDVFGTLALSPDGRRLAVEIDDEDGSQIWVKALPDGALVRLTTEEGVSFGPTWSPDGRTIAYLSGERLDFDAHTVASDGRSVGAYEILLDLDEAVRDVEYTPDGQGVVFREKAHGISDIGFLDLTTGEVDESLLATEFGEWSPTLSPDGRWMAYASYASGNESEVLVRPFPDVHSGITQVSRGGGDKPVWSRSGGELFYRGGSGWMRAVTYSSDSVFTVERTERLFDTRPFMGGGSRSYGYSPTDDRFVMVRIDTTSVRRRMSVRPRLIQILNFFTELEERMGGGR